MELPKFGILIATRNRPEQLAALLESLTTSTVQPNQVVIISSGDQIANVILKFTNRFPIKHLHIEGKGQIRQKMIGIKLLLPNLEWVAFLDDDLLLKIDALQNIFKTILNHPDSKELIGVGFADSDRALTSNKPTFEIFYKIFGISTSRKGAVLRNGQNNSYMSLNSITQTSWLNGAAMWRKEIAESYGIPFLDASYSICEDLIFSYPQSKKGILIFDLSSQFSYQNFANTPQTGLEFFSALTYWRMYFVLTNSELSIIAFLWAQIGRTIHFMLFRSEYEGKRRHSTRSAFLILIDVFILAIRRKPPLEILKLRQSTNR